MSSTIRYTLLLDPKASSNVERLQQLYGLRSKAAVFDLAATLLLWVAEQQSQGYRVGRSDGKNFAEVLLPAVSADAYNPQGAEAPTVSKREKAKLVAVKNSSSDKSVEQNS